MQISGGIQPQAGAGQRWYANVPLLASGPTAVTVSFQNGGLQESCQVQWQATDLLQANNLTVRQGDTLLFSVGAEPGLGHGGRLDQLHSGSRGNRGLSLSRGRNLRRDRYGHHAGRYADESKRHGHRR